VRLLRRVAGAQNLDDKFCEAVYELVTSRLPSAKIATNSTAVFLNGDVAVDAALRSRSLRLVGVDPLIVDIAYIKQWASSVVVESS
jgi:hypothetical protein